MPGPSNNRRNNKQPSKKQKSWSRRFPQAAQTHPHSVESDDRHHEPPNSDSSERSLPFIPILDLPPLPSPDDYIVPTTIVAPLEEHIPKTVEQVMFQEPFIHDPGNGPRVRGARAFISSFFAIPPAIDDPLCAEFAQEEVLQMLCTVLPEETALILWYNKSRAESRVCPACQRLYRLGDVLPDLLDDVSAHNKPSPPQLLREQKMSGLCSPVCFIMASFNYPSAIKSAWGCTADEMDETTWSLLNEPRTGVSQNEVSHTLGMLVRMTRLHDLGLAQLCFGAEEASRLESAELGYQPQAISAH